MIPLYILSAFLAFCAGLEPAATGTIYTAGDSLAPGAVAASLHEQTDYLVEHRAVPGSRVENWLDREAFLAELAGAEGPVLVWLSLGTNNRLDPEDQIEFLLCQVVDQFLDVREDLVVIHVDPAPSWLFPSATTEACPRARSEWVDTTILDAKVEVGAGPYPHPLPRIAPELVRFVLRTSALWHTFGS